MRMCCVCVCALCVCVCTCGIPDWDCPVDLSGVSSADPATSMWQLMPPELFRPMEVPFDLPGSTDEIPCPLPPPYLHAMAVKKE